VFVVSFRFANLSYIFFNEQGNPWKVFGTALTFGGVVAYTHLQQTLSNGPFRTLCPAALSFAQDGTHESLFRLLPLSLVRSVTWRRRSFGHCCAYSISADQQLQTLLPPQNCAQAQD